MRHGVPGPAARAGAPDRGDAAASTAYGVRHGIRRRRRHRLLHPVLQGGGGRRRHRRDRSRAGRRPIRTAPRSTRGRGARRWTRRRATPSSAAPPSRRRPAARPGHPRRGRRAGAAGAALERRPQRSAGHPPGGRGGADWWAGRPASCRWPRSPSRKLAWVAEHEPDNLAPDRRGRPAARLADRPAAGRSRDLVTDRSDASGTGYFDPSRDTYLTDLVGEVAGRDIALPRGAEAGRAGRPDGARRAGRPRRRRQRGRGDGARAGAGRGRGLPRHERHRVHGRHRADRRRDAARWPGSPTAPAGFLPLVCTLNAARVLVVDRRPARGWTWPGSATWRWRRPPTPAACCWSPTSTASARPTCPTRPARWRADPRHHDARRPGPRRRPRDAAAAWPTRWTRCAATACRCSASCSSAARPSHPPCGARAGHPRPARGRPEDGEYVARGAARQAAWVLSGDPEPPRWGRRLVDSVEVPGLGRLGGRGAGGLCRGPRAGLRLTAAAARWRVHGWPLPSPARARCEATGRTDPPQTGSAPRSLKRHRGHGHRQRDGSVTGAAAAGAGAAAPDDARSCRLPLLPPRRARPCLRSALASAAARAAGRAATPGRREPCDCSPGSCALRALQALGATAVVPSEALGCLGCLGCSGRRGADRPERRSGHRGTSRPGSRRGRSVRSRRSGPASPRPHRPRPRRRSRWPAPPPRRSCARTRSGASRPARWTAPAGARGGVTGSAGTMVTLVGITVVRSVEVGIAELLAREGEGWST